MFQNKKIRRQDLSTVIVKYLSKIILSKENENTMIFDNSSVGLNFIYNLRLEEFFCQKILYNSI